LAVLAFQILVAVVILAGLITVIMSVKNWHWAQMVLLLLIFFCSIGVLFLGLEVYRIHKTFRGKMPALQQQLAQVELKNEALKNGTGDNALAGSIFSEMPFDFEAEGSRMPGLGVWTHRLQDQARQRGRVWRGVMPAGPVDARTSRVPVQIQPQPHGLEQDAIVSVFEQGEPNAANPAQGAQYLGDFRVVEVRPDGVTLEAVIKLDKFTGPRVAGSKGPWALYETLPADRHELFAGMTEEQLRQLIPAASVDEYIRHGQKVEKPNAGDAFNPNIAMLDEQSRRVGPDNAEAAVTWLYERQLRDYAFLFAAENRRLVELVAQKSSLQEDLRKLAAANKVAEKFSAMRTDEKQALAGDKAHLDADRAAVEALLATIDRQLANAQRMLAEGLQRNSQLVAQLTNEQMQMLEQVDAVAPAPGGLLAPQ
jgi:hypothetical protein